MKISNTNFNSLNHCTTFKSKIRMDKTTTNNLKMVFEQENLRPYKDEFKKELKALENNGNDDFVIIKCEPTDRDKFLIWRNALRNTDIEINVYKQKGDKIYKGFHLDNMLSRDYSKKDSSYKVDIQEIYKQALIDADDRIKQGFTPETATGFEEYL